MGSQRLPIRLLDLFLHDFQQFHRACFDADAAGNALGGKFARLCLDHQAEGTGLDTLAAAAAELFVDGVDALRILRDGAVGTCFCAFAALNAEHRLGSPFAVDDLKAGLGGIKFFVEGIGTGTDALQTGHALDALFRGEFFHGNGSFSHFVFNHYTRLFDKNQYFYSDFSFSRE